MDPPLLGKILVIELIVILFWNVIQGFFVTVRAGTAHRHLFSKVKKKIICDVYY